MSIPKNYLEALGRISVNFAQLEFELFFLIGRLSDTDQDAARVISEQMTFRSKCELVDSLCKLRLKKESRLKEAASLVRDLNAVRIKRNRLLHSTWGTGEGDEVFSAQRKEVVNVKLADLQQLGDQITEAARRARRFKGNLMVWFPGLYEERREPWTTEN